MAIRFKRSLTPADVPVIGDIPNAGEIAINVTDGRIWASNGSAVIPMGGHGNTQTFTSSGTWVNPEYFDFALVMLWGGAGGGGGGVNTTSNTGGGGGGGGSFTWRIFHKSEISGNQTVTIGAGGDGNPAWPTSVTVGKNGGNSSFGTLLYAYGGCGGYGANNSTSSNGGHGGSPMGGPSTNGTAGSVNTANYWYQLKGSTRYPMGQGGNTAVGVGGVASGHGFGGGGGGTTATNSGGVGADAFGGGGCGGAGAPRNGGKIAGGTCSIRSWPWGHISANGGNSGNGSVTGNSGFFPSGGGGGTYGGQSGAGNSGYCTVYTW